MQIKTIFLDAGGVLVHPNWERVSAVLETHGILVLPEKFQAVEPHVKYALDNGAFVAKTNDQDRFTQYLEFVFQRAGLTEVPAEAYEELHAYHAAENLWESVADDVFEVLEDLHAKGYTLVIVSNANGTLRYKFGQLGLADRFDYIFDSHEHGIEKPDPAFFELALRESNSQAATTIHIGDFYHIDIIGARAAGITPVLLDAAGLYGSPDCHTIETLRDIDNLLVQLNKAG